MCSAPRRNFAKNSGEALGSDLLRSLRAESCLCCGWQRKFGQLRLPAVAAADKSRSAS